MELILFDVEAPAVAAEEFPVAFPTEVEVSEVVDEEVAVEDVPDEEDIVDMLVGSIAVDDTVGVIRFGAGEAVLWLDTESGLTDSSITISPGDPGESGGRSLM